MLFFDIFEIFLESIKISPDLLSQSFKIKFIIVDFPAQVFQTKATVSHFFIDKFRFFKIFFSSVYQKTTFLNSIFHSIFSIFSQLSKSSIFKFQNSL
jgi:hypothetical protein